MDVKQILLYTGILLAYISVCSGDIERRPERYCKFFLGEDNGLCLKSDECFNSSSCSGDHVCCDTGCSKMCAAPIAREEVVKEGICPKKRKKCGTKSKTNCAVDLDCGLADRTKCCDDGCDKICVRTRVCKNKSRFRKDVKVRYKRRQTLCSNCTCLQLWQKGNTWFKRACRKRSIANGCCLYCFLVNIE